MVFQLPNSPEYCAIGISLSTSQIKNEEQSGHEDNADNGCNIFESCYNGNTCNMLSSKEDVVLMRPTKEEIDAIIAHMVS